MSSKKKIFLLITDAGAGHRASAMALVAWALEAGLPYEFRIVNMYKEVWKDHEAMHKVIGIYAEDLYNLVLKKNAQAFAPLMRKCAMLASHLPQRAGFRAGVEFFRAEKPDLCISMMPFVNDILSGICAEAKVPLALVSTDLMDTKPYMWFSPLICRTAEFICAGSEEAMLQASENGAAGRVVNSGLVIHPKYFKAELKELDQGEARRRFELDPDLFTVSILMGGYGGKVIREFVERFEESGGGWQVVAACGKNEELRLQLDALRPSLKNRLLPLGFSTQIPALMRASDLLVTKPGPASLMEALSMNCPMALDDVDTMPQEVPNAAWVMASGLGLRVRRRSEMFGVVKAFAADPSQGELIRGAQARKPMDAAGPIILGEIAKCLSNSTVS